MLDWYDDKSGAISRLSTPPINMLWFWIDEKNRLYAHKYGLATTVDLGQFNSREEARHAAEIYLLCGANP